METAITDWMARHGIALSRVSLGMVFFWFGALKLVPGASPAEDLACRTLMILTGGLFAPQACVFALGIWESLIGLGLLTGRAPRATLISLFGHMAGTVTPLVLFPGEIFVRFPFALTFEGQYIAKNVVLVSAAIVVGATLRGGSLQSRPDATKHRPGTGRRASRRRRSLRPRQSVRQADHDVAQIVGAVPGSWPLSRHRWQGRL